VYTDTIKIMQEQIDKEYDEAHHTGEERQARNLFLSIKKLFVGKTDKPHNDYLTYLIRVCQDWNKEYEIMKRDGHCIPPVKPLEHEFNKFFTESIMILKEVLKCSETK
jgi:hypothetical protein